MPKSIRSVLSASFMAVSMALTLTACESNDLDLNQPILGGEAVDDSTLVNNVKTALSRNGQTALLKITVTSVDDVIILKGIVGNDQERESAIQVAGRVDGVRHVTDSLYTLD